MAGKAAGNAAAGSTGHAGRGATWLCGLGCGMLVILATPVAMLLGILLAPTLGTLMLDRSAGRGLGRIVLLFGAAVCAHPLMRLLSSEVAWGPALQIASDPAVLAAAWGGQILGGLLAEVAPPIIRAALDAQSGVEAARLRADRQSLEAEWGFPPRADPDAGG